MDGDICLGSGLGPIELIFKAIPKNPSKKRLDQLLVDRGLVPTRTKAQALIMAGQVKVKDVIVTKGGSLVR